MVDGTERTERTDRTRNLQNETDRTERTDRTKKMNSKDISEITSFTKFKVTPSDNTKTLDDFILDLKILSKIKSGQKLSLGENNNIYIDTSYLQYFYRLFGDSSRNSTIEYLEILDKNISAKIETIINNQEQKIDLFLDSKENILLNISHNLSLSLVGLNNLINTYISDELIVSKLEMLIHNFELKIRKISNLLKIN